MCVRENEKKCASEQLIVWTTELTEREKNWIAHYSKKGHSTRLRHSRRRRRSFSMRLFFLISD